LRCQGSCRFYTEKEDRLLAAHNGTLNEGSNAMQCPKCKQILDTSVRFCPHDGTPLVETGATVLENTPTGNLLAVKELQLPVVVGNRYRLLEKRGGGGMAKVYRASDLTLEREVAVKLINPELRTEPEFDARFQREARIASQLADPHIVVVHDFGLDANLGPYLVMEYLQGESLRERLMNEGKLPLKAVIQLAGQLFLALIHAHSKGVVHRDIKPDNIFLLNVSGVKLHVRVLDFGIARIYSRDDGTNQQTITQAGAILGTPRYMSPEQLAGRSVDAKSDIYSAALVTYEALTGTLPYGQSQKLCELCPEVPLQMQELLEECLDPDPAKRPPNTIEVYLRLQELGKASGILLLPPGAMNKILAARRSYEETQRYDAQETMKQPPSRRGLLVAGVLAVVAALAVGVGYFGLFNEPDVPGPERLAGIAIGDSLESVEAKVTLSKVTQGNPWLNPRTKANVTGILTPQQLRLPEGELGKLLTRKNADDSLVVIISQETVVAVLSKQPTNKTNRRVKVGDGVGTAYQRYANEKADTKEVEIEGTNAEIRTYRRLGLSFEVLNGQIDRIAIFPKTPE
jgi:tRNA A-37 threonylcarbamoyl transferase component Bud32